jgi:hypothetical protein
MGRLAVVVATTVLALAAPARAAELTHVASSAEPNKPFELDLSIRWERQEKRATITREYAQTSAQGFTNVIDAEQLRLDDVKNLIIPRLAVGLYQDLEFHAEVPYVLADEDAWRYASGVPTNFADTIGQNTLTPNGTPCATTPCALFPVQGGTTVYKGGVAGDIKAGLAWGIFSDRKDDTKPFWLVGLDVTFPSAKLYDPALGRDSNWLSPYAVPSRVGPVGEKIWKYDMYTALSRRMGAFDPYFKAHVVAMQKSSSTYSNCLHAAEATAAGQATSVAVANCALPQWQNQAAAKLPFVAGLTAGAELIPYEDAVAGQKISIDLRVITDYTSSSRWYNELTDATGKLLATEAYLTMTAQLGLNFRASDYVSLQTTASLGTSSPHYITGEGLGGSGTAQNPNYDWRWDAPGRRFRVTDVALFNLMVAGVLQF